MTQRNIAIHTYQTSPSFQGLFDFELILLEYSATKWKAINGPIYLCADKRFQDYLEANGKLDLYDKVIDLQEPFKVNQRIFWAAGKLFAYEQMGTDYHFIDIDAVAHEPIPDYKTDIVGAHYDISPVSRSVIGLEPEKNLSGVNMCFSRFNNSALLAEYISKAYDFMRNPSTPTVPLEGWEMMVYAEQTILLDIIETKRYDLSYFRDDSVPTLYHLWGGKQKIISGEMDKNNYIRAVKNKIKEWHHLLQTSIA
jgi:hypothetical protein